MQQSLMMEAHSTAETSVPAVNRIVWTCRRIYFLYRSSGLFTVPLSIAVFAGFSNNINNRL